MKAMEPLCAYQMGAILNGLDNTHCREHNSTRLQKLCTYMCNIVTEFYLYSIVYIYLINSRLDVTHSVRHHFRTIQTLSWCQTSGKSREEFTVIELTHTQHFKRLFKRTFRIFRLLLRPSATTTAYWRCKERVYSFVDSNWDLKSSFNPSHLLPAQQELRKQRYKNSEHC